MPGPGKKRIEFALEKKLKKGSQFINADKVHCSTGYLFYGADVLVRELGIDNWLDKRTPVPMCVLLVLPDKKKHVND